MTHPQTRTTDQPPTGDRSSDALPDRPSLLRVVRDQRKVAGVAVIVMVACFWVMGPLGEWSAAALTSVGVLLALLNHLAGELWLAKLITSGEQPSRASIAASASMRLLLLAVVAVAIAAAFWPDGVGLLLGLALFRLVALVMTGLPLLKELKKA